MTIDEKLAELKSELQRIREIDSEREKKIQNQEMDLDDCFVSRFASNLSLRELEAKISLLGNGGLHEYSVLMDIESGEIISDKIIATKYGATYLIEEKYISKFGKFISATLQEKTYTKKGVKITKKPFKSWVKIAGDGKGFSGLSTCQIMFFRVEKWYWE